MPFLSRLPWKRFWSQTPELQPSDGYLPNPEGSRYYANEYKTLENLEGEPCVVLLGESGLGKSSALRDEYHRLIGAGSPAIFLDLADVGREADLTALFAQTEIENFRAAKVPRLTIFLDSTDEALLRMHALPATLVSLLSGLPTSGLRLRIACRPSSWRPSFSERIAEVLQGPEVRYLQRLRRVDIENAIASTGLPVTSVLQEIENLSIEHLASIPILLDSLLRERQSVGALPKSKLEVYDKAIDRLLSEHNVKRVETRQTGTLTPDERRRAASLVGAICILCRKARILIYQEQDFDKESLSHDEVFATLAHQGQTFRVDDQVIVELLNTSLFSSRGEKAVGWLHQSYAEYLAAEYLTTTNLSSKALLAMATSSDRRIIPELYDLVGWLASRIPSFRKHVLKVEPLVLLRADMVTLHDSEVRQVVKNLFRRFADKSLSMWELPRSLNRLRYAGLGLDLKREIEGPDDTTRYLALHIAEECASPEVFGATADILQNKANSIESRAKALRVLSTVRPELRHELKPYALEPQAGDSNEELKGAALDSLWPGTLSSTELFAVLEEPQNSSFVGNYSSFLHKVSFILKDNLTVEDLPVALDWVKRRTRLSHSPSSLRALADEIILKAWDFIHVAEVCRAFAEAAVSLVSRHDDILGSSDSRINFSEMLASDDDRRRHLASHILQLIPLTSESKSGYLLFKLPFVIPKDSAWLLRRISDSSGETRDGLLELFGRIPGSQDKLDGILDVTSVIPELLPAIRDELYVELDSSLGIGLKKFYNQELQWSKPQEPTLLKPPPRERVESCLKKIEEGKSEYVPLLLRDMTLEDTSTHYGEWLKNTSSLPGWVGASLPVRERILNACDWFLRTHQPDPVSHFGKNSYPGDCLAGCVAAELLRTEAPGRFHAIEPKTWSRWALTVLWTPNFAPHLEVLLHLSRVIPKDVEEAFERLIAVDAEGQHALDSVVPLWTDSLEAILWARVTKRGLEDTSFSRMAINHLLSLNNGSAYSYCESLLTCTNLSAKGRVLAAVGWRTLLLPMVSPGRLLAVGQRKYRLMMRRRQWLAELASESLLSAGLPRAWPAVRMFLRHNRQAVQRVCERLATPYSGISVGTTLRDYDLGEFVAILFRAFPPSADPQHSGAHIVGPREGVSRLRSALFEQLVNRGSIEAISALTRLSKLNLADLSYLPYHIERAKAVRAAKTWQPPTPAHVVSLGRVTTATPYTPTLVLLLVALLWGAAPTFFPNLAELPFQIRLFGFTGMAFTGAFLTEWIGARHRWRLTVFGTVATLAVLGLLWSLLKA